MKLPFLPFMLFALLSCSAFCQNDSRKPDTTTSSAKVTKSATAASFTGIASFYTEASCKSEGTSGVWTASGARFDETAFTCAMRSRHWGDQFKVTNLANGKTVEVTLTDFGPGKGPTAKGVVIDLTPAAYHALGYSASDNKKAGFVNDKMNADGKLHVLIEPLLPIKAVSKRSGGIDHQKRLLMPNADNNLADVRQTQKTPVGL